MNQYVEDRSIPITLLDGKLRHLFLGFNAFIKIVKTLGIDISNLQSILTGPNMFEAMRGILWAGLVHEDKALTVEDVGDLIDTAKIGEISIIIMNALSIAFGTAEGEPKNAETPVTPATETSPSTVPAS